METQVQLDVKEVIGVILDFYIGTIILKKDGLLDAEFYPLLDAGIRLERICCMLIGIDGTDFVEEFKVCDFDKEKTIESIYLKWLEKIKDAG